MIEETYQVHYDKHTVFDCRFEEEPVRVFTADRVLLLEMSWPGFNLEIPWPEGMTAEQAVESWKRS